MGLQIGIYFLALSMQEEIMKLIFPEELLEIFEVRSYEKTEEGHLFYIDERPLAPEGYDKSELESKGFDEARTVSDFPLRGKPCKYKIRRRKWLVKQSGKVIKRSYKIYANGTRKTEEFASFLKEVNRYYTNKL